MRAVLVHHREAPLAVAPDHEILAEEPCANRRTVRFRDLLREACGHPVAAKKLPHGRVTLDSAEKVVLFAVQHGSGLADKISLLSLSPNPPLSSPRPDLPPPVT